MATHEETDAKLFSHATQVVGTPRLDYLPINIAFLEKFTNLWINGQRIQYIVCR